jgi:transketolase
MDQGNVLTMVFGRTLVELGRRVKDLVVIDANLSRSTKSAYFGASFPGRFIDVGLSQLDLFGTAAGLAASGIRVVASTHAASLGRAIDQIAHAIGYPNLPVRIVATHAGLSHGPEGAPRQALFDVALLRAVPNLSIIVPADEDECRQVLEFAVGHEAGPLYIRLGSTGAPRILPQDYVYRHGRGTVLAEGSHVGILSSGPILFRALEAVRLLEVEGVSARLAHLPTVKPLDEELVLATARQTGALVTVEEHSVVGGFGSAVAETLARQAPTPVEMIGMPDRFGESAQPEELRQKYGLTVEGICDAAHRAIARKA